MSYWQPIRNRAFKESLELVRLDNPGRALMTISSILIPGATTYASLQSADPIVKILSALGVIFVGLISIYLWKLFSIPPKLNSEKDNSINKISNELDELKDKSKSDISIDLDDQRTVHHYPGRPDLIDRALLIANTGAQNLTDCVLRIAPLNSLNKHLFNRTWMQDASLQFSLRPNEVKRLPFIYFDYHKPSEPALPESVASGKSRVLTQTGVIMPNDDLYVIEAEVLSANTYPAKLSLNVYFEHGNWQVNLPLSHTESQI